MCVCVCCESCVYVCMCKLVFSYKTRSLSIVDGGDTAVTADAACAVVVVAVSEIDFYLLKRQTNDVVNVL